MTNPKIEVKTGDRSNDLKALALAGLAAASAAIGGGIGKKPGAVVGGLIGVTIAIIGVKHLKN